MTTLATTEYAAALAKALHGAYMGQSAEVTMHDGRTLRVEITHDPDTHVNDSPDVWGKLEWDNGRHYEQVQRPKGFNGNAEVVATDHGSRLWWQPPADISRKDDVFNRIRESISAWCRDEWHYVVVSVELHDAIGANYAPAVIDVRHLGGVEDEDEQYIASVIGELVEELLEAHP